MTATAIAEMTSLAPVQPLGVLSPVRAADKHPVAVYLARLGSEESRRTMARCLATIADVVSDGRLDAWALPWDQLRYAHTHAVRAALAERYAPATANKHLAALRGVLVECRRLGLMSAEDQIAACDLAAVRGETLAPAAGRMLDAGELRALFHACAADPSAAGRRDAALIAVLAGGGLRRSEAAGLDVDDYDTDQGVLTVRRGKGRKARTVPVRNGTQLALEAWIIARPEELETPALFVPVRKGGAVQDRRMSAQTVLAMLRKRARQADVASFSPHDLRRTFISCLLDAGADVSAVQRLAGHADVSTTVGYDRRGERAKANAAGLVHVPYVAPPC